MNTHLMTDRHQTAATGLAPWAWTLDDREATTLAAVAAPRWLRVDQGCVWVTASDAAAQADDLWLSAGESLALPAGSAWVLEAWPRAQLSLLQAAPVLSRAAPSRPAGAWWAAVRASRLLLALRLPRRLPLRVLA